MNTRRKQFLRRSIAVNFPLWLLLAVLIVTGCTGPNPESIPTLPATQSSPGQPTGEAVGGTASAATGEPGPVAPPITLSAHHAIIEYSPRPQPPTTPPSLDDIAEPPADSWQTITPDTTIPFNSYDSLRVMESGEALLDLGGFMQLLLKRDAVAQFTDTGLAGEAYDRLLVQPVDTPPLQEWVLSLHLLRGGFSGELEPGEGPVALTTPNAVIIVSGTQFFAAYDPAAGRTWVANFDGTIHVGDVPLPPGGLDDHTLAVIPPLDGRALWDIPPGLTMEDFGRLVDETGSPLAAAALLSGPTLLPLGSTGLAVYDAPAPDATQLGVLPRAHIVALRRGATGPEGEPYWEIACPAGIAAPPRGCWVRGGLGLAAVYNAGGRTPGAVTLLEPAGDCAAGNLSRFPHAGSVTLRWRADAPAANEFIGLRLGPAGESLIFATADPAAHQTAPGEWAYTAPVAYFYRPGVAIYQWQVYRAGSDGLPLVESATGCFQVEPPIAPATPIPDSDGDGWLDPADACPRRPAGARPNPFRPGCPAVDSDGDGWMDELDQCVATPAGAIPDPANPGCPLNTDGDPWIDEIDQCVDEPAGRTPDPERPGCPLDLCPDVPEGAIADPQRPGCPLDTDGDGWIDELDECVETPAGESPDPDHPGCPLLGIQCVKLSEGAKPDPERPGCALDTDGDGVPNGIDECAEEPAGAIPNPYVPGCPQDSDEDGVPDETDECDQQSMGDIPDPKKLGCPLDSDGDGWIDEEDECDQQPAGELPDTSRPGCPLDSDSDGVPNVADVCPDVPAGELPDPQRPGCPLDSDGDGVPNVADVCPDVPAGPYPDKNSQRRGCPRDWDGDGFIDEIDQCIDVPAGEAPDPQRPGCPLSVLD